LIRGVLLGENPATTEFLAPTVLAAAQPFRSPNGGYHLENAFRYTVGSAPR